VGSTGRSGRGPGEFNGAQFVPGIDTSDQFYILDLNNRKLHFLEKDSVFNNSEYFSDNCISTILPSAKSRLVTKSDLLIRAQLSDSTFLAVLFPAFEDRFAVVNSDMDILRYFGTFPEMRNKGVSKDMFQVHYLSSFYQKGMVHVNHENKRMLFSHSYLDMIEVYNYATGEKLFDIIGPEQNYPPEYETVYRGNWSEAMPCKRCKKGYLSITSTNDCIYVLYPDINYFSKSGSYSKFLFQFDWEGNPVCRYELDKKVWSIAVDEQSRRLFAIDPDNEHPLHFFRIQENGTLM
jgi:hypothetical protein